MRGDFPRGIFAMTVVDFELTAEDAYRIYRDFYDGQPFTIVADKPVDLKQVVNTNKAVISLHVDESRQKLLITTAIDNLLKGASGQAVQNFNIMFGLDQRTGLRLKPSAF